MMGSGLMSSSFQSGNTGGALGQGTQQTFVGRTASDRQAIQGGSGLGDFMSAMTGLANRGGQSNRGQQGRNSSRQERSVRIRLMADFDFPAKAAPVVSQDVSTRLTRAFSTRSPGPLAIRMEGRRAILEGTVASERDRDLAQRLALLEPGIDEVQNDLAIGPPDGENALPTVQPAELPPVNP
jgi:osmotically-inducible protein OsmY